MDQTPLEHPTLAETSQSFEPVRVRKGPALFILAIVALIAIGGSAMALIPSHGPGVTQYPGVGTDGDLGSSAGVRQVVATGILRSIATSGSVPADISSNLTVPAGTRVTGTKDLDSGGGQFDRSVYLQAPFSQSKVIDSYLNELPRLGWRVTSTSSVLGNNGQPADQILAQRGSSDGYYWEVGLTIMASKLTSTVGETPPGTENGALSARSKSSSTFTLRLLQIADGS